VIDPAGQRVSARDRLYLAAEVPSLVVWGGNDRIIPVRHGRRAHEEMPDSRFVELSGAGHFPQLDQPRAFVEALLEFMLDTRPARVDVFGLRDRLLAGSA
jgi:pimeloyl-ACP methyl ester carboxylesterase